MHQQPRSRYPQCVTWLVNHVMNQCEIGSRPGRDGSDGTGAVTVDADDLVGSQPMLRKDA
eukprot:2881161-Rhodomonas_salina.1